MASSFMTPGVYIKEENAFPGSAVAVETAVPVFLGYTEKAERNGKSLVGKPVRITSFAEYREIFGGAFRPKFTIAAPADPNVKEETFTLNSEKKVVKIKDKNTAYFYNAIRLFYANGGSACYIYSVGVYGDKPDGFEIKASDFTGGTADNPLDVFDDILAKEYEPTMIVMPDIIALGNAAYPVYVKVLAHCAKMQSRIGIFDIKQQTPADQTNALVLEFRTDIGNNNLNYGTAYYPWLRTSIVQPDEVDFENLGAMADVKALLTGEKETNIITEYEKIATPGKSDKTNLHQSLVAASPTYVNILNEVRARLNELPPSAAMAGIYTMVDNSRGVWKSPANVSVNMVNEPVINISNSEQESLNVDLIGGKSINVIRPFPGLGTLVWGARTLDGNSQDWRYINVRRTLIMIEQSLKLATRAYVFEPNDAGTWITIKSMITNFLVNLWKQGALAGAVPEQAFDVQIGLGATMTPNDILDGILRITVRVAVVRPAEFIIITFQQLQQQS